MSQLSDERTELTVSTSKEITGKELRSPNAFRRAGFLMVDYANFIASSRSLEVVPTYRYRITFLVERILEEGETPLEIDAKNIRTYDVETDE